MSKKPVKDKDNNQIAVLQDQLARALADYDNFRKRTEREREQLQGVIKAQMLARLLPALDMLMETQKHLNDPGLAMSIQEFLRSFKEDGIEIVKAEIGKEFDESLYEAVDTVEDNEKEDGVIAEEVATGWKVVDGPIIRHAKVKVVKN